jgi:hypothetical protein
MKRRLLAGLSAILKPVGTTLPRNSYRSSKWIAALEDLSKPGIFFLINSSLMQGSLELSQDKAPLGETIMEAVAINSDVRQLCKAVSEEEDSKQMLVLLDELLRVLDERQPVAALL